MNISIDIRTTSKPLSGVGYYVFHLIHEFQALDSQNRYLLISNKGESDDWKIEGENFENFRTRISNENHWLGDIWENTFLPYYLKKKKVDVFHGPAFLIPLRKNGVRTVVTIPDIVSYILPETIPFKYAAYMRFLIRQVAKRADRIITISHSTKNDLVSRLDVPEDRIRVVHVAASDIFRRVEDRGRIDEVKSRYGIRKPFMLFVGNLEPRKNLIRLAEAFARANERMGRAFQLVICGKEGWLYRNILKTLKEYNTDGDIALTRYVSREDLVHLYCGAECFLFPTLYEGFGLPVVEAMRCGTPVITSNISSLPEIMGDAGILIDPESVEEIAEAIGRIAQDDGLKKELRERGLLQAQKFSWKTTALETLKVYREVT